MIQNNHTEQRPFFALAATVAGTLESVMQIAREISIAAKNAKAIAERAGEKANGFRPITDYINEIGQEMITLVKAINKSALKVSRIAVDELRAEDAYQRLISAKAYSAENTPESIHQLILEATEALSINRAALENEKNKLIELLMAIKIQMRATAVISTCSRVEATRADEYETNLEAVAVNVEIASDKIKHIIKECDDLLNTSSVSRDFVRNFK
jgi:hypothetical protein